LDMIFSFSIDGALTKRTMLDLAGNPSPLDDGEIIHPRNKFSEILIRP